MRKEWSGVGGLETGWKNLRLRVRSSARDAVIGLVRQYQNVLVATWHEGMSVGESPSAFESAACSVEN